MWSLFNLASQNVCFFINVSYDFRSRKCCARGKLGPKILLKHYFHKNQSQKNQWSTRLLSQPKSILKPLNLYTFRAGISVKKTGTRSSEYETQHMDELWRVVKFNPHHKSWLGVFHHLRPCLLNSAQSLIKGRKKYNPTNRKCNVRLSLVFSRQIVQDNFSQYVAVNPTHKQTTA